MEAVWQRNAERVRARLALVVQAVEELARGGAPGQEATQEAHVLAGVLGTYGRPGSPLLRQAELALAAGQAPEAEALVAELRALAVELRA